jgi:hypothetical protein
MDTHLLCGSVAPPDGATLRTVIYRHDRFVCKANSPAAADQRLNIFPATSVASTRAFIRHGCHVIEMMALLQRSSSPHAVS